MEVTHMAHITESAPTQKQSDRIIYLLENILMLEALAQGIKIDHVRSLVKVDKRRVNAVSKLIQSLKK
jgi:diphthamide synthase (EF-2-diphthine--ammonia ligase)